MLEHYQATQLCLVGYLNNLLCDIILILALILALLSIIPIVVLKI